MGRFFSFLFWVVVIAFFILAVKPCGMVPQAPPPVIDRPGSLSRRGEGGREA